MNPDSSAPTPIFAREVGGRPRRSLPLALYQSGLLLLGAVLLGIASESTIAPEFQRALPLLYTMMVLWCAFQVGTLGVSLKARTRDFLMRVRIAIDLVFCLAIVWLTGGVVSFFLPLLFASVLVTSTFLGLHRAWLLASVATVGLTIMTLSQILGWRPAEWTGAVQLGVEGRIHFLLASLIGHGIALHLIAFLGARLKGGLERAEWLNDQIVASIDSGIIVLDSHGRISLMNDASLRMLNYPLDTQWRGLTPPEVFRRDDDAALRAVLEDPEPGIRRTEWKGQRGTAIPFAITCSVIDEERSRGRLTIFLFQDMSLEQRATRAEERLRSLAALEDLALGLVHEIRNPLASIRGCVQELGAGRLKPDQVERLSGIVVRESDRLDRIVNEFLECSSTNPTQVEPIALLPLVEEVVDSLRERDDADHLQWRTEGDPDAQVEGHRELLYRVLLNLGVNAVEASGTAGEIAFEIRPGRHDGWQVDVEDQGCGIDDATRKRIFNPFFTTKTREGGLGLALVERIVHGHGGSIEVESQPGRGSRFRVWLPASTPVLGPERAPEADRISSGSLVATP